MITGNAMNGAEPGRMHDGVIELEPPAGLIDGACSASSGDDNVGNPPAMIGDPRARRLNALATADSQVPSLRHRSPAPTRPRRPSTRPAGPLAVASLSRQRVGAIVSITPWTGW